MFDIGFSELMVIGVVALIVIGPERLPGVARTIGHLLGRGQRYVSGIKSDIDRELQLDEIKRLQAQVSSSASSLSRTMSDVGDETRYAIDTASQQSVAELAEATRLAFEPSRSQELIEDIHVASSQEIELIADQPEQ